MAILNLEELKRQIKDGTFIGLESLENAPRGHFLALLTAV